MFKRFTAVHPCNSAYPAKPISTEELPILPPHSPNQTAFYFLPLRATLDASQGGLMSGICRLMTVCIVYLNAFQIHSCSICCHPGSGTRLAMSLPLHGLSFGVLLR